MKFSDLPGRVALQHRDRTQDEWRTWITCGRRDLLERVLDATAERGESRLRTSPTTPPTPRPRGQGKN